MEQIKKQGLYFLRWLEKYTKTDMLYFVTGSFWLNLQTVVSSVFALILSIALAHFVSKNTYGTYQFILSLGTIITSLTLTGMNTAVTSAVAQGFEGTLKESIRPQLYFGIIPFLVGLSFSLYYFLQHNLLISFSLVILSICIPIINTFNTSGALMLGKKDFKSVFLFNQINNVVYYGSMILVIFYAPYALTLIAVNFAANSVAGIYVYNTVLKKYKPNNLSDDQAILYGKKLSLSNIIPAIALQCDNLLVFHFLGPVQLAIYAFASTIPERLGSFFKPISNIAFPKFSQKTKEEIRTIIAPKTLQLCILMIFFVIGYIVCAPFIFKIFFPAYIQSIFYSQLYVCIVALSIILGLPLSSLFATRSKHVFVFNVINPIVSIILIISGVLLYGIIGVIAAKTISNLFSVLLALHLHTKD